MSVWAAVSLSAQKNNFEYVMNQNNLDNITLALAGILQAVALVRELPQTGRINQAAYTASIHSVFQIHAEDVATIYNGMQGVKLGLEKIVHTFDIHQTVDKFQHRYLLSLIHLQKKLSRSPKILTQLTAQLQKTQKQVDYFSLTHPTVIANLADIYLQTISLLHFRIIILGTRHILHVKENLEKVRALLLAGVRSAVLWRQVGGSRLQLLFSRAKIKATAEKLLQQIDNHSMNQKDVV
jgi:high frequency lysogenization protein